MPHHYPFRLTPNGTDLSCWQWMPQARPDPRVPPGRPERGSPRPHHAPRRDHLGSGHRHERSISVDPRTRPGAGLRHQSLLQRALGIRHVARPQGTHRTRPGLRRHPLPSRTRSHDGSRVFILGLTVPCSTFLQLLERDCRRIRGDDYAAGSLAQLAGDPSDQPPSNPVVQARFLAEAFQVPKGSWPPRVKNALEEAIEIHSTAGAAYVDLARVGAAHHARAPATIQATQYGLKSLDPTSRNQRRPSSTNAMRSDARARFNLASPRSRRSASSTPPSQPYEAFSSEPERPQERRGVLFGTSPST